MRILKEILWRKKTERKKWKNWKVCLNLIAEKLNKRSEASRQNKKNLKFRLKIVKNYYILTQSFASRFKLRFAQPF